MSDESPPPSFDRSPTSSRYARLECERRFLLARVPPSAHSPVEITDRYIDGTMLRLRRMRTREGREIHKLGQKVRPDPGDPSVVLMTNIYISAAEHSSLTALPAALLGKTRFRVDHEDRTLAVDVLHGDLAGLVVAEASFDDEHQMRAFPSPDFAAADVTADERYTGSALARAESDALEVLLPPDRRPMQWSQWHEAYTNPESALSQRLTVVQDHIRRALDTAPEGPIQLVSLCAGEGRDVLPVLTDHPRRIDVAARLVENDPVIADRTRQWIRTRELDGVEVITDDAGDAGSCRDAVPAEIVMVCGVFGNLTDDDVRHTISRLPMLCTPGATVIWTRHRRPPDLTPAIRDWFGNFGFQELCFDSPGEGAFGVGSHRLVGPATPLVPAVRLFTFIR